MSLLEKIKSMFSGGSSADADAHAGHDHSGDDRTTTSTATTTRPILCLRPIRLRTTRARPEEITLARTRFEGSARCTLQNVPPWRSLRPGCGLCRSHCCTRARPGSAASTRGDRHHALAAGDDGAPASTSASDHDGAATAAATTVAAGDDGAAACPRTAAGHRQDAAGHGQDAAGDAAARHQASGAEPGRSADRDDADALRPLHRHLRPRHPRRPRADRLRNPEAARVRPRRPPRGPAPHGAPQPAVRDAYESAPRDPATRRRAASRSGWRSRSPRHSDSS